MAVSNYSLAYPHAPAPFAATVAPHTLNSQLDDLLYSPELHQQESSARENEPYSQPARRSKLRKRAGTPYLPPPNQFTHYPREPVAPAPPYSMHTQLYENPRLSVELETQRVREVNVAYETAGQGEYIHDPSGDYDAAFPPRRDHLPPSRAPPQPAPPQPAPDYTRTNYRPFDNTYRPTEGTVGQHNYNFQGVPRPQPLPQAPPQAQPKPQPAPGGAAQAGARTDRVDAPVQRPPGFTKVEGGGGSNTKTQLHAVLDYDDDYYDDVPGEGGVNIVGQKVTPLQGPILLKNGTVPVVPLFSYPTVNNGSYYQIPILWTALSLALGYELQGQVIKGVPCVKRNYQLYCPTAGNTYPLAKIESFIDENKALMKRMYGAFGSGGPSPGGARRRRAPGVPDPHPHDGDSYFRHVRQAQVNTPPPLTPNQGNSSNRLDACESKTEIVTPYWALNSARKLRAVVNTMHFEQAIHQEVCSKTTTARCAGDCGCEQKYKWHRLLAYDPDEDCTGIFMDWFLFPSCCVCRCNP